MHRYVHILSKSLPSCIYAHTELMLSNYSGKVNAKTDSLKLEWRLEKVKVHNVLYAHQERESRETLSGLLPPPRCH